MSEVTAEFTTEYFTYDDILDSRKLGGKELPLKQYDPYTFWESMGSRWYETFDRREKLASNVAWMVDRLKVMNVSTLLDAGCGFGRLLPFALDAEVIKEGWGVDISPTILKSSDAYLEPNSNYHDEISKMKALLSDSNTPKLVKDAVKPILEREAGKTPIGRQTPADFRDKIHLELGDIRQMKYLDGQFDCVMSNETLQHLKPTDVYKAAGEMKRVAGKYILCMERWAFPSEHSEPHIWSHDLSKIFSDIGCDVLQCTTVVPGIQGLVIKK